MSTNTKTRSLCSLYQPKATAVRRIWYATRHNLDPILAGRHWEIAYRGMSCPRVTIRRYVQDWTTRPKMPELWLERWLLIIDADGIYACHAHTVTW